MKPHYFKKDELTPAIPPEDYKGSIAGWMVELVTRGLWDDSDGSWYGDVMIEQSVWWEILEQCEK